MFHVEHFHFEKTLGVSVFLGPWYFLNQIKKIKYLSKMFHVEHFHFEKTLGLCFKKYKNFSRNNNHKNYIDFYKTNLKPSLLYQLPRSHLT
jgi:hypothetical protein